MTDVDMLMEDSLDGGPPSVGSGEIPTVVPTVVATTSTTTTPVTAKKVFYFQYYSSCKYCFIFLFTLLIVEL